MKTYAQTLREQVQKALPEGINLRLAKGTALYFVRYSNDLPDSIGFLCCIRDQSGYFLFPTSETVLEFERQFEPVNFLMRSLERFRGVTPCAEAIKLFSEGIKLIEQPEKSRIRRYQQKTRELAALNLRLHCGGSYALARIAAELNNFSEYPEFSPCRR